MNRRKFITGTAIGGFLSSLFPTRKVNAQSAVSAATEEDRPLQCSTVEGQVLEPGKKCTLVNLSGGPGSVETVQLAIAEVDGPSPNNTLLDSRLRIIVDGETIMNCDLGTFFLMHGSAFNPPVNTWITDDLAVTEFRCQNAGVGVPAAFQFGAFRRLFIPYRSTCKIKLINGSDIGSGKVYAQLQHRSGPSPTLATAPRRTRLRVAVTPFTAVDTYGSIDLLPTITGRGVIDSIQMIVYGPFYIPVWLEGNCTVSIDGGSFTYGGTEDFFGTQYYGYDAFGKQSDSWGMPMNRSFPYMSPPGFITGMYRFFKKDPLPFNQSAKFTWTNGGRNQGFDNVYVGPPGGSQAVYVSALVFYYLDQ